MIEAMQQTEHYKLNLIEMDDPISPLPLNENTQVLDQLVAGIAGEQHLFRLGKVELTEANGPISLDLSGADLTKYDALFMLLYRKNDSGTCFMNINGTGSVAVLYSEGDRRNLYSLGLLWFVPIGDRVVIKSESFRSPESSGGSMTPATTGGSILIPWADIHTIALTGNNHPVGSGAFLLGIKF